MKKKYLYTYIFTNFLITPAPSAPKCYICTKSVYKMEEGIESLSYIYSLHIQICDHLMLISHIYYYSYFQVIAIDRSWHKLCFKCGGANTDGCNRTLTLDAYSEHNKEVLS